AHGRRPASIDRVECYALALAYSSKPVRAWPVVTNALATMASVDAEDDNLAGIATTLAFELGRYRDSVAMARVGIERTPLSLHPRNDYLKAAFSAGALRREREAVELFGRQFTLIRGWTRQATDADIERVIGTFAMQTLHTISPYIQYDRLRSGRDPKIGVFFLSSTDALGHA